MMPHARYDYILVNDSDISVRPEYLRYVMHEFHDRGVGLVTCLYRGIGAKTLGSKLEALSTNSDFLPGVLCARQLEGGVHFGLGSTLAFPRKALESIGGFSALVDYLGDDYELGKRISEKGLAIKLGRAVVDHYVPDYSFADYWSHQL